MRTAAVVSCILLAVACARAPTFGDPPRLGDLMRCPARLSRGDTSAAVIFYARKGAPADSVLVRVTGGHRGQRLPLEAALVALDSGGGTPRAPLRWSDPTGLAWLVLPPSAGSGIVVRFLGTLPLRTSLPADARVDSVHVFLQIDTPTACYLQKSVQPGAGQ